MGVGSEHARDSWSDGRKDGREEQEDEEKENLKGGIHQKGR